MLPPYAKHCLLAIRPLNMIFLKIVLMSMGILRNNMAQQVYKIRTQYPIFISNCSEQQVDSLLLCAAFGQFTKDATFFFHTGFYHCRWNCTFIFNSSVSDENYEWRKYGKGSVLNIT